MLAVGPTSPDNGFPVWYKDSNNLSVGLCLDDANPFCNITSAGVPDVTGPGGTDVATVQISPVADVLDTSQVEFRQSKSEWRIQGTATVVTGNTVKIHLGDDLTGPLLNGPTGSSVDALGAWSFRIGSGPQPPASRTISIESSRGRREARHPDRGAQLTSTTVTERGAPQPPGCGASRRPDPALALRSPQG